MPLLFKEHIERAFVRTHPNWMFVFGDNFANKGLGGQAAEMRGEPNVLGLATKKLPATKEDAYLSDKDYEHWHHASFKWWSENVEYYLRSGSMVVFPSKGLGTGLAELPKRAPRIHAEITKFIGHLRSTYTTYEES